MTTLGYIVVGVLMLLDIISIMLCKIVNEEELKNVSIFILLVLLAITINFSF
jgi:hypothetical protein